LAEVLDIPDAETPARESDPGHVFFMVVAGLTSVADWIASNEDCFDYCPVVGDRPVYAEATARQATKALQKLGWTGWQPPSASKAITGLFGFIDPDGIRPLQAAAGDIADRLVEPGMVFIEAPTGEGKTEAAMLLADRWAVNLQQQGCYFALPTQATSNQMFRRVKDFLAHRYDRDVVNLQLLHGHSALSAEFELLKHERAKLFSANSIDDDPQAGVAASEWFTHRKRGLLAPFGVGTIDQALLAVLQTKHVFVRLFGLAHKTIIIDEVHAYDTYMSTLLERLLQWLAALGSSVVLLSATLPKERRRALLAAYASGTGHTDVKCDEPAYPRLIRLGAGGATEALHVEESDAGRKALKLRWCASEPAELGQRLREALADGGCAAVICNTVARAQAVYLALKDYFPEPDAGDGLPELDLLHARYLYCDREARERRSLLRFGHPDAMVDRVPAERPHRAILVATQIIEQSLDLDFDLMITDVAPVDLVLQRAGRLHRHDRARPGGVVEPTLWIAEPAVDADGVPVFGEEKVDEYVYDRHVLLRSWLVLKEMGERVQIPDKVERLVEGVYGDETLRDEHLTEAIQSALATSRSDLESNRDAQLSAAQDRMLKRPTYSRPLWRFVQDSLDEDSPEAHRAFQALTRLSGPTVPVVCLHESAGGLRLESGTGTIVDLDSEPPIDLAKSLLRRSFTLSHATLTRILSCEHDGPAGWRKSPWLRHHRVLRLNANNEMCVGPYRLRLDMAIGLEVTKSGSDAAEGG